MAELTEVNVDNPVACPEKENESGTEVLRPKFQWCSKPCVNVAVIQPLPRSPSSAMSPSRPQSVSSPSSVSWTPSPDTSLSRLRRSCTQVCPFSFDLRDSMRRVAREQALEELRRLNDTSLTAFQFKANPVRRYKPFVLKHRRRVSPPSDLQ